jgi:chemotaxis protein MotB
MNTMRSRRNLLSDHEAIWEIWPSFTDVMSTMALILFVLVLLAYVRNLVSSRRLDVLQHQIVASEVNLHELSVQIATGKADLDASQERLLNQQEIIADSNRQLDGLRGQLQSLAVLRVSILSKLKEAIATQLGGPQDASAALVRIGDNGNVLINESLVFEYDSYAIKDAAKPILDTLAKAFGRVLADDTVRANIDTILIQGHTDRRGSVSFNWDLSARRATAVVDYLFQANKALADNYGSYFAAAAYSEFRPLDPGDTEAAYAQNRRIEISVVPKDASARKAIDDYLSGESAALRPPGAKP